MSKLLNSIRSLCWNGYRFIRFVTRHFIQDDCTYRASALAFTTLLAIVPLMSVGLSIFSSFPVFQDLREPLQNFIFENFVPATGKVIQNYLLQFTAQVSRMSFSGIAFLFVTAILVMVTIESSLNNIWRVAKPRKGVPAFLLYWAILSLTPILLGLSIAASSWFVSIPIIRAHNPPSFLLSGIPFFLSFIAYTFLYIVVPNCYVALRHAVWGGLTAAILFEIAKNGFAWYLTRFNTYELLYGAFAIVPIFFIWVYWVWVITLLGAEISYALSVHYERRAGKPIDGFTHTILWLEALWKAQRKGEGMCLDALIDVTRHPYEYDVNFMINLLMDRQLIHYSENAHLMLSTSMHILSLAELAQMLPFPIPSEDNIIEGHSDVLKAWREKARKHHRCVEEIMQVKLEDLFAK